MTGCSEQAHTPAPDDSVFAMADTLRVLMVISHFYPLRGGAEQQALQLAHGLVRRGVQVGVLTRSMPGLPPYEDIGGIAVHRRIRTVGIGKLFGLLYAVTVCGYLVRHRNEYDIIHCHLAHGLHSPVAVLVKVAFKKPVIIKVGATGPLSDFTLLQSSLAGGLLMRLLRRADRIVAVCGQAAAEAVRAGIPEQNVAVIHNGVDLDLFAPAPERQLPGCITFIGRLDAMKGVDVLLQAFARLMRHCAATLRIVGDGPERDRLRVLADRLGIGDAVLFFGVREDIPRLLQESSVFALPSRSEGLPNVVLEAMACGLPVVATRVGGTPELVQDGRTGLLVQPNDPEALRVALQRLLNDPTYARELGACGRRVAQERFGIGRAIAAYYALYDELKKE